VGGRKAPTVGRRVPGRLDRGQAPGQLRERPCAERRGEASVGASRQAPPVGEEGVRERGVERGQLRAARPRVKRNGGSPGRDGMTVEAWPGSLREHGARLREGWRARTYRAHPGRRVESPKAGGGVRTRGLPTAVERCMQPAVRQGLQPMWDPTFSGGSDGVRPGRSAHPAVAQAPRDWGAGYGGVVDLAREKCFARGQQDQRMRLGKKRGADRRGRKRIDRDLQAGVRTEAGVEATVEGRPQGGPLAPLLTNRRLDGLDKAVERRGHRCVRSADDRHSFVKSARAGQRVLASVTRFLARRLQRAVHTAKRAGDRPWRRTSLGLTCTRHRPNRRRVREKALEACTREVGQRTSRTRGVSRMRVVRELRP
jgi:RNA-directed DNA polymerase